MLVGRRNEAPRARPRGATFSAGTLPAAFAFFVDPNSGGTTMARPRPPLRVPDELTKEAERIRYDAGHRPVDRFGLAYDDFGPNPPKGEPAIGGDRDDPRRYGTLDPYHPDAAREGDPAGSPARPKAPPVRQATEDGRLYVPAADGDRKRNAKS